MLILSTIKIRPAETDGDILAVSRKRQHLCYKLALKREKNWTLIDGLKRQITKVGKQVDILSLVVQSFLVATTVTTTDWLIRKKGSLYLPTKCCMRVLLLLYFWPTAFKMQRSKEEQYQHVSRSIQWHNFESFVQTYFRNMIKNWRVSPCLFFSEALKLSYAKSADRWFGRNERHYQTSIFQQKDKQAPLMLPSLQFSLRTESSSGGTVVAVTCETFSVIVLISGLGKMRAIRLQFGQYCNWAVIDIDETVQIRFRSSLFILWTIPGE